MSDNDVEALEVQAEQAREAIQLRDDLVALQNDRRFQNVFMNGYIEDDASRLVQLLGDPNMQDKRDQVMQSLQGIAEFGGYMRRVHQYGAYMEEALRQANEEMDNEDGEQ